MAPQFITQHASAIVAYLTLADRFAGSITDPPGVDEWTDDSEDEDEDASSKKIKPAPIKDLLDSKNAAKLIWERSDEHRRFFQTSNKFEIDAISVTAYYQTITVMEGNYFVSRIKLVACDDHEDEVHSRVFYTDVLSKSHVEDIASMYDFSDFEKTVVSFIMKAFAAGEEKDEEDDEDEDEEEEEEEEEEDDEKDEPEDA